MNKIDTLSSVYFSATRTTKKIAIELAKSIDANRKEEINLTHLKAVKTKQLKSNDLLLIGVPSYSGRVPQLVLESISFLKGDDTPAIIFCTYGGRDYDDTLIELKDIITHNGFRVISAAAFVAQHSIFPKLAKGRPDVEDMKDVETFAQKSIASIQKFEALDAPVKHNRNHIEVSGSHPYRDYGKIPIYPKGNSNCTQCGICSHSCPVQAIDADTPRKTNKNLCIKCGRCIALCPEDARAFGGLLYYIAGRRLSKKVVGRKNNSMVSF